MSALSLSRVLVVAVAFALAVPAGAQTGADPAAGMDRAMAAAEGRLAAGDLEGAERHYRVALFEGWLLKARLDRSAGHLTDARQAVAKAAEIGPSDPRAALSLASAQLELGDAAKAVATLTEHGDKNPGDLDTVRLFVRALAAAGQEPQAVKKLDQAVAASPGDVEVAFVLATDYLWLKQTETADRLLAQVVEARPFAETHVLVGRAYRDTGEYARARRELQRALAMDPGVRRAHYYLGTVALSDATAGPDRIDQAIAEFREELRIDATDALVLDQLGVALLEAGQPEEALPPLESAVRTDPRAPYFHHLGRAQLATGRTAEAVGSLRRAVELSTAQGSDDPDQEAIHYRLGTALRALGPEHGQEAAAEFAEAKRLAAHWTDSTRRLTALDGNSTGAARKGPSVAPATDGPPVSPAGPAERSALRARVQAALARCYLNLGVIRVRGQQFARAAELLDEAAALEPGFPGVQFALGVARFNAGDFARAVGPLARAAEQDPGNRVSRRLLALASIDGEAYSRAIALLHEDPELRTDPSLEVALGRALALGGRAADGEATFTRLLREHGASAPLLAGLGEALAQQDRFDPATEAIARAFQLDSHVPDARTTMGFVHLRQGRPQQAQDALRAELAARPGNTRAQRLLAAALVAQGMTEEAATLLREIVDAWPEAAEARLALSQAYERLGRAQEAAEQMEAYRKLTAARQ